MAARGSCGPSVHPVGSLGKLAGLRPADIILPSPVLAGQPLTARGKQAGDGGLGHPDPLLGTSCPQHPCTNSVGATRECVPPRSS